MAITNEGDSQSYAYTGGMQSFTAPQKGIYKLEAWGAQGGAGSSEGNGTPGKGGYSYGHVLLEKGAVLYICCGQAGATTSATMYNGGGGGKSQYFDFTPHYKPTTTGGSGGGATHIATRSGTLAELGSTSGLLIVAGGGGGAAGGGGLGTSYGIGGSGGGESGGAGVGFASWTSSGGTQTSGYAFGQGQTATSRWGDWDGTQSYESNAAGGGGGGLYGGIAQNVSGEHRDSASCGGGGGSGYIGGVPTLTYFGSTYANGMQSGQRSGNGYAVITFVKKGELPVIFNGTTLQKIIFNGVEIESLIVNGVKLFCERMKRRVCEWLSGLRGRGSSVRAGTAEA